MRIVYIAAGAADMICGSCLRDNTLAGALKRMGHDVLFMPVYTPLRTDEGDESNTPLFMGGINVYLQSRHPLVRRLPRALLSLLDNPGLLKWAGRRAGMTDAHRLGELTVATLQGEAGPLAGELARLCEWLARLDKPDIVNLPNFLLLGLGREIKRATGAPLVCTLSGEDYFLASLPEPYQSQALTILRERAREVDAFVATTNEYADRMAALLGVPRERFHAVPLGISLEGHGRSTPRSHTPFVVGFLGRIVPEKGVELLINAFERARSQRPDSEWRLRLAGYLAPDQKGFLAHLKSLQQSSSAIEFAGELSRPAKTAFLNEISLLAVPTLFPDPKGLPVLEAWANGVPVIAPRHGAFPEHVAHGGGLLFEAGDVESLAAGLLRIHDNAPLAEAMAAAGYARVRAFHTAEHMAEETLRVYQRLV